MLKFFPHALAVFVLTVFYAALHADTATLYLLNGTVVRGEIVDRSTKFIQVKTPSSLVRVKTSQLMPISRAQLKLPSEIEKEDANSPEMEAIITQMEKLVAENDVLKKEIETLKAQLGKNVVEAASPTGATPAAPAEGPSSKR